MSETTNPIDRMTWELRVITSAHDKGAEIGRELGRREILDRVFATGGSNRIFVRQIERELGMSVTPGEEEE